MKILFTGKSGLVGKNILPTLMKKYEIDAPGREQLNLLNEMEVEEYVKKGNYDVIVHSANPNPAKNTLDQIDKMFEESMRCFMNLYRVRNHCKKLFFIGSGAEFDKREDMIRISENEFDRSVPHDVYGYAKYIMTHLANASENVYNLRLFACYGPTDGDSKFITHVIRSILKDKDITIRQDCMFDYLQVYDLINIISYFIDNEPHYHDYNLCSGKRYLLSEIAEKIKKQLNSNKKIIIEKPGMNKEYTANNSRLLNEMKGYDFISLEDGIKIQIESELKEENL